MYNISMGRSQMPRKKGKKIHDEWHELRRYTFYQIRQSWLRYVPLFATDGDGRKWRVFNSSSFYFHRKTPSFIILSRRPTKKTTFLIIFTKYFPLARNFNFIYFPAPWNFHIFVHKITNCFFFFLVKIKILE